MAVTARERDAALGRTIKSLGKTEFSQALSSFVRGLTSFDNLIVIVYSGQSPPSILYREYTDPVVYRHMDSHYVAGAYQLDPFYLEYLKGADEGVRRLVDIAPSNLQLSDYFFNYYQETTLVDEVAVFAHLNEDRTVTACFGKDRSSGAPFTGDELKALRTYENVLSSLLETHWKSCSPPNPDDAPNKLGARFQMAIERELGIKLTPRQAEVAKFILQGHSTLSTGLHLGISSSTVKVFRRQLYGRCNISSQAELFSLLMPLFCRIRDEG